MKTIDQMKRDRKKTQDAIEKLKAREKLLDKEIEEASMKEVWLEALKNGVTNAKELREKLIETKKENSKILMEGHINEA